jgi:hypothetical protein
MKIYWRKYNIYIYYKWVMYKKTAAKKDLMDAEEEREELK